MSFRLTFSRRVAVAVPAVALLLTGVVTALPSAAADYTETGTAKAPAATSPTGFGVTDTAFLLSGCEGPGDAQGVDGWVFLPPAAAMAKGAQVTLTATSGGAPASVGVFVYDADCDYLRTESGTGTLRFATGATDRFLSAYSFTGVQTTFALTVQPAVVTDPTETASPSASASPSPGSGGGTGALRARHTYDSTPNDPLYPEPAPDLGPMAFGGGQWGMQKIRAAEAWQRPRATGAGVRVAVLDSGLDIGHPDFACAGKVLVPAGANPTAASAGAAPQDGNGHGTHVAGIVGACTDNGTGVVGVAPDATVLPVKILDDQGSGNADDLVEGIRAAADAGAHVINMSIGFAISAGGYVAVPGSGSALAAVGVYSDIDDALAYARERGVVVIAAAGNETAPICGYPALAEKVVCVGSTDRRDLPAFYGNFPLKADGGVPTEGLGLVAPGGWGAFCDVSNETIVSTYTRTPVEPKCDTATPDGYAGASGTSMASPHVAGVAALVYDRLGATRSPAAADKVLEALKTGVVDLGTPGYDPVFGYGRIDAVAAVEAVTPVTDPDPTESASPSSSASPSPSVAPAADSTLTLTAPASGQRTDTARVTASLTSDGKPVAGQPVRLALTGGPATELVTDAAGAVQWDLPLSVEPGRYELTATYAGSATVEPSGDHQPFDVLSEDTVTSLTSTAGNPAPTLSASVADADTASSPVADVPVIFLVDGAEVATVRTDASGTATYTPAKKAKRTYGARFDGDSRWRASGASQAR